VCVQPPGRTRPGWVGQKAKAICATMDLGAPG
jgi:hypothetical protein